MHLLQQICEVTWCMDVHCMRIPGLHLAGHYPAHSRKHCLQRFCPEERLTGCAHCRCCSRGQPVKAHVSIACQVCDHNTFVAGNNAVTPLASNTLSVVWDQQPPQVWVWVWVWAWAWAWAWAWVWVWVWVWCEFRRRVSVGGAGLSSPGYIGSCVATTQPSVRKIGKFLSTSQPKVPLMVDFGERVMALDPLKLFNATGFGR